MSSEPFPTATPVPYLSHATPLDERFTLQGTLRTHRLHTFLLWDMAHGGFWKGWWRW